MISVNVVEKTFDDTAAVLGIEVGTNCPQSGDSGYGGRTIFTIKDEGSVDLKASINDDAYKSVDKISVILGGDSECKVFIEALSFALEHLKKQLDVNAAVNKIKTIE